MNFSKLLIPSIDQANNAVGQSFMRKKVSDVFAQMENEANRPLSYADAPASEATIAVIDTFRTSKSEQPRHGDDVHAIILNNGFAEKDTVKIRSDLAEASIDALGNLLYQDGDEPFEQRLDAYIELTAGNILSKTNGIFRHILGDQTSQIKTINQSQGESRFGIYSLLLNAAWNGVEDWKPLLTDTGRKIAKAVGSDPTDSKFTGWELNQKMIDRVNQVVDKSRYLEKLKKEHEGLLLDLRGRGISVVTSAGNNNDDWLLTANTYNHRISDNFDDDITSVGEKLVVGALDTMGTPEPEDDEIARFSSRYVGVDILAPGINIPTLEGRKCTGTSCAAPIVTAQMERLRREDPAVSPQELEQKTRSMFRQTDGYNLTA